MADELQALLDRIHQDGVQKAAAEREKLLAEARAEADRITQEARQQAAAAVAAARREAETSVRKGQEALRQAARDTLLSLRQQLQERLRGVVRAGVGEALTPEALAPLLARLVEGLLTRGEAAAIEVLVDGAAAERLQAGFLRALAADLRQRAAVVPVAGLGGGFKLVFDKQDVVYDFSDTALAEALCTFLNPKLAELVQAAAGTGQQP